MDDPDTVRFKIKVVVTDVTSQVTFDPVEWPGISNLVCIHSRITGQDFQKICEKVCDLSTGQFKNLLQDLVINH